MSKLRAGHYAFTNDIHINAENFEEKIQTVNHEFVHKETTGVSTFGILLIFMEKSSLVDNSKEWLFNELLEFYNKMQERTATFIEYYTIIEEEGLDSFNNKVEDLRRNNKTYYKYFAFIYDILKTNSALKNHSVEDIVNLIKTLSIISSNVEVHKLPFDKWQNKKDMQRFFTDKENLLKFSPNKRFETLIKSCIGDNIKYTSDTEIIKENTYLNTDLLNICQEAINLIYKNSRAIDIINERISKFNFIEFESDKVNNLKVLSAFPKLYNLNISYEHDFIDQNSILEKLKYDNRSILEFHHLVGGLEETTLFSYISTKNDKLEVATAYYDLIDIIYLMGKTNNPIVLSQSKLYTMIKDILHQSINYKPIYIFMENSFLSSYPFINTEFNDLKYIQIPEEKYDIVAIKNKNFILIQLILKNIFTEVREILGESNITPANFVETLSFNIPEIKHISRSLFLFSNLSSNHKNYGFK